MQQWEHCVIGRTIGTYSPAHNWNNYKYFNILKSENNVHTFWHVKKKQVSYETFIICIIQSYSKFTKLILNTASKWNTKHLNK